MANFESISNNLKNNDKAITHAINNFSDISDSLKQANLKHTILEVNKAVTDLAVIMDKIEKGEGTVGQLLNNKQMYMNLESASKNMDALIIDLKAHPKRYVHFSVFGGKKDKASK
jgi:phospholipid/cholesterol/gamma-HCH transport system substrate-binding protein